MIGWQGRRHRHPPGVVVLADGHELGAVMLRQLFIGQCLVLALHLPWMPAWLVGLALVVAVWRYFQLRQRVPPAGRLVRLGGVALLLGALWLEYGALHGMDGLIGLLLGVYLLKLLETHDRRDARVVVVIGIIATGVAFLHYQGILMALGALMALAWLLQSLTWLAGAPDARRAWSETGWLLLFSAPLMVALFLAVPRLGPLWSMPQMDRASTGLTDEVSPGDIAQLSRSDARAFRVSFDGEEPATHERYWRVYTLSGTDGRRWFRAPPDELAATLGRSEEDFVRQAQRSPWVDEAAGAGRFRAELLLEPDSRPWLPSLGTPLASDSEQRYLADGTLERVTAQGSRSLLRLESSGAAPTNADPAGDAWNTLLPTRDNPRTRALGERLWQESGGDTHAFLAAIMAHFGESPFRYTLMPPRLGSRHRVDEFLFESRAGYCTHYASAAATLIRAAGLPARLVVGFLGGERHPDGYFTVRDYDAHAWVEVWLDGAWQRLDPTAAIAPGRIELGPQAVEGSAEAFLADSPFSSLRLRELAWANRLRLRWENLEYQWQRGVIGYQREAAREFMLRLGERLEAGYDWLGTHLRSAWAVAAWLGGTALALAGSAWLLRHALRQRRWRHESAMLGYLQCRLERLGLGPDPGETPAGHLRRVAPACGPAGEALRTVAEEYERLAYAPLNEVERSAGRRRLRKVIKEMRRRLPKRRYRAHRTGAAGDDVAS
ncbi:transglutaminase TgpA family protein [Billgrantia montanilacus]|uniref:DUF3488 domain-containing protein n=1 Tax=Billgrantia montanilacus TaxID=2282305 RepID=A0A368TVM5_9GAMM|nr:DUF3488 and transglutaminase-like domain-containing protein [Halomonas montanilacus]RCV87183.1 DUF3488 domain-containing protein [Halomonas montanilacus]